MVKALALVALLSFEHPIEAELAKCLDKNGSTQGMVECEDQAAKKWDAELNRVYKELMAKLKPESQKALKESQLAWIRFRDQERLYIQALYGGFDGTMYRPMAVDACKQVIRQRAEHLQHYLEIVREHSSGN